MDHGSIGVFGLFRRPITHWVESVIDAFTKPIAHPDKPAGIVIAVLDPVSISRGHLQQITDFVVPILGSRRINSQTGKPALRGVAEGRHHPVWVSDTLRIAVAVETGKRVDLTQRVGHRCKVALGVVCIPSNIIHVSTRAIHTRNLPQGSIGPADRAGLGRTCQPSAGNTYCSFTQERNGHAQILEIGSAHRDVLCRVSSRP
ncbi:hypothetical protein ALP42_200167 [Pseudomonas savastanoi pv. nerii]|uniref:Uncharacterized protein n=1 Tax=Pseudomonas savastanoi pv. nerii TaxID=360921 RepID=A0AB74BKR0_PSESS|nr:hypothetical protein ALP42_200167 [Pseudomonas savastanoi pv. nerii]